MKTHWLYGFGPNKEVKFNVEVDEETICQNCIHVKVCRIEMDKRCSNWEFADSKEDSRYCSGCLHKYTRFDEDEDKLPCFHCKDFMENYGGLPNAKRKTSGRHKAKGG